VTHTAGLDFEEEVLAWERSDLPTGATQVTRIGQYPADHDPPPNSYRSIEPLNAGDTEATDIGTKLRLATSANSSAVET
jgi:hypothetical protein